MLDPALERQIRSRLDASAFVDWMGLRLHALEDGRSELHLEIAEHHLNPGRIVHGGIIATLLDAAIGLALRTKLGMDRTHVTVNLSVNYLKPFRAGTLIARGRAIHSGGRTGYGEADLLDIEEAVLARGNATFLVIDLPAEGVGPAGDAG